MERQAAINIPEVQYRLPLARELFENRPLFVRALDLFPQCRGVVPQLRECTRSTLSIEVRLQEIESQATTYPRAKREIAAVRCYLQRALADCEYEWRQLTRGVTNYLSLLREIDRLNTQRTPVCLVTFNYDTLLEGALTDLGIVFEQIGDYTTGIFQVFKLHGSLDWAHELNLDPRDMLHFQEKGVAHPPTVLTYLVNNIHNITIRDEYVRCGPSGMGVVRGQPVFPAIAIPVEKKSTFECPNAMILQLKSLLPRVTHVLVIGWRATEAHFLYLLNQHLPPDVPFYVVAESKAIADTTGQHIRDSLPDKLPHFRAEDANFTQFILTGSAEKLLSGILS